MAFVALGVQEAAKRESHSSVQSQPGKPGFFIFHQQTPSGVLLLPLRVVVGGAWCFPARTVLSSVRLQLGYRLGRAGVAKRPTVKGGSPKTSNEKTISLEEFNTSVKPEFHVANKGSAPSF